MKRILLGIVLIFTGLVAQSQAIRSDVAILDSITHISAYFGGSKYIQVKDSVLGGAFYLYQGVLPVDGTTIIAGANSSKWKRMYGSYDRRYLSSVGGINNFTVTDSSLLIYLQNNLKLGTKFNQFVLTNTPYVNIPSIYQAKGGSHDGNFNPSQLLLVRKFNEALGDTLVQMGYGGATTAYSEYRMDSNTTRFRYDNKYIVLPNYGFYSDGRFYAPRDSVEVRTNGNGQSGSGAVQAMSIGDTWGYNIYINSTQYAPYPLAANIATYDFMRNDSRGRKRQITGNGVAGYVSDWKNYQYGTVSPSTNEDNSYINKVVDFYSMGGRNDDINAGSTKAKIMLVSKVDSAMGFYSRQKYHPFNEVWNGYGFVQDGVDDYNHFQGRVKIGTSRPNRNSGGIAQNLLVEGSTRSDSIFNRYTKFDSTGRIVFTEKNDPSLNGAYLIQLNQTLDSNANQNSVAGGLRSYRNWLDAKNILIPEPTIDARNYYRVGAGRTSTLQNCVGCSFAEYFGYKQIILGAGSTINYSSVEPRVYWARNEVNGLSSGSKGKASGLNLTGYASLFVLGPNVDSVGTLYGFKEDGISGNSVDDVTAKYSFYDASVWQSNVRTQYGFYQVDNKIKNRFSGLTEFGSNIIYLSKDSIPYSASNGSRQMLTVDTATGIQYRMPIPAGGGGGSVSASQGADVSGSDVRLGVAAGSGLNAFTTDRQINMGNRYLSFMGNKTNDGEFHLKFDDTLTSAVGTPAIKNWVTFRSPDKSFATQDFRMHSSITKITGIDSLNHIFNMGFGFNAGGGALQTGRTGIGYSLESHYEPVLGTSYAEMHEWFISRAGTQIRFKSTTIDKATNNITTDYRTSTINFKNVAGTDWMAFQENSVVGNLTDFTAKSYNGRTAALSKIAGDAGNSGLSITDAFNGNALYINKTGGTDQALHVANGTSYFKDNIGLGTPALTGGFGNYVTIGTTYPAIRLKHLTKDYFLGINDPSQTGLQFQNFATSRSIFYFREDGDAIIGNSTSPSARLTVHAEDAGAVNYALRVRDNASNELMAIRNDGLMTLPSLAGNIIGKRTYDNSTNAGYNPIIFEPLSTDTRASRFYFKHNQTAQVGTFPNNVMKFGWNPDLVESSKKGLWFAMEQHYTTDSIQEIHQSTQGPTWGETRLQSYTVFLRNGLLGENQATNIFSNLDIRAETINFLTTTNRSFGSISQNKTSRVTALTLQSGNGVALNISVDSTQQLVSFNQQFGPSPRVVDFFRDGNTRDVNMYNFRVTTNAGVEFQGYAGVNTDSTHDFGGYSTRWKRFYAGQVGMNRQLVGNLAAWGNHFLSGELIKYTPYGDNNSVFLRMTDAAGSGTTFSILNNGSVNFPTTSTTKAPFNVGAYGTIPTSPTAGDVVFDASDSSIKVRSGSNWIPYYYGKEVVAGTNITIGKGAWNVPDTINASGGGGISDGDKGDITVTASGATWTIDNQAVTYAKIQNVTDARLLGRSAGSAGSAQEITVSSDMSLAAGVLGVGSNVPLKNATNTFTGTNTFNTNDVTFSGIAPMITGGAGSLKFQDGNDGKNFGITLNTRKFLITAQQSSFSYQDVGYFMVDAPANAFSLWTTGTWRLNTTSTATDVVSRKLYVNGSIGMNKDSADNVTSLSTAEQFLLIDNTTGKFKKATVANVATSLGINTSGTWVPTYTYTTNTSTTSSGHFRYQQIGDQVYIQGDIVFNPTSTGVAQLDITLPFANGITNSYDVSGTGVAFDKAAEPVEIFYNNSGGTIAFKTTIASTGTRTYKFTAIMHYQAP